MFPMLKLRDYQKRCCESIWSELSTGSNALIQAPTGAGKSCIVAAISNRLCNSIPNGRVLILVDREILVTQLADSIAKFFPALKIG